MNLQKVSDFRVAKNNSLKVFFCFFPLKSTAEGSQRAKNAVQPNSYSKRKVASHFEFSVTRSMEFSIGLVPEKLVIIQFHWPRAIKPRDDHINNYIKHKQVSWKINL